MLRNITVLLAIAMWVMQAPVSSAAEDGAEVSAEPAAAGDKENGRIRVHESDFDTLPEGVLKLLMLEGWNQPYIKPGATETQPFHAELSVELPLYEEQKYHICFFTPSQESSSFKVHAEFRGKDGEEAPRIAMLIWALRDGSVVIDSRPAEGEKHSLLCEYRWNAAEGPPLPMYVIRLLAVDEQWQTLFADYLPISLEPVLEL